MASLLSFVKKAVAQVNPLDNGRTWQNPQGNAPQHGQPAPSAIHQLTHNGLTNTVGNVVVKPFVLNPLQVASEVPRAIAAEATNNLPALQASQAREWQNIKNSIPGFVAQQGINSGQAGYNLAFKAPVLDLMNKTKQAEQARVTGLNEFNRTLPGAAARPAEVGIANLAHASKPAQAQIGLDPNATGAQKYFADPLMGAVGTVGLAKGTTAAGKASVDLTKQAIKAPVTGAKTRYVLNQAAVTKAANDAANKTGAAGIKDLAQAEGKARFGAQLQEAAANQPKLLGSGGGNFTIQSIENQRIAQGTEQLAKQYQAEADNLAKVWGAAPKRLNAELNKLDQTYQGRHANLMDGVGEFATQVPKAPGLKPVKAGTPEANARLNTAQQAQQGVTRSPIDTKPSTSPKVPTVVDGLAPASEYTRAPKSPGAFQRAWQTVGGVINQHGTGGAEFTRRFAAHRNASEIGQEAFLEKIPTVSKLDGRDFQTFVQALDKRSKGEKVYVDPHIEQAIGEWNAAIPEIRDRAVAAGLKVGDLGENYFPRQYKDINSQKGFDRMVNDLMAKGKTRAEAVGAVDFMRNEYQRPFGNLERTRQHDLPGYEQTHEALTNYINRSFDRITKAEQFGSKNEILSAIKARMQEEGYDISDRSTVNKYMKIALGDVDKSGLGYKVSGGLRQFNAATSLSTAGISNATQLTNTGTIAGVARTAKGVIKLAASPKARAEAKQTGVLLDHSINNLAAQGLGVRGKITRNIASPFFQTIEKFNRQATAIVGKDYGNHLAKKGDVAQLRDKFGVTGEIGKTLTRDQEIQVSRALVKASQFKVDPYDLPGWVDSPMGKLAAQFRTFGYKQTDFMYNHVLREASKGNFLPLGRFIAVGAPAGAASLAAKGLIKRSPYIQGSDSNQSKVAKGLSQVGGFGLPGSEGLNILNSAKYKNTPGALASTVGGPTVGLAVETGDNIRSAQQGKSYKLKKEVLRKIPAVGPTIANTVFPPKNQPQPAKPGETPTPAQNDAKAKEEKKAFTEAAKKQGGYTLDKLSNGKFITNINGDVKEHPTLKSARAAIAKDSFTRSDASSKVVGQTYYYKDENGDTKSKPLYRHEFDVADSQNQLDMTIAKDDEDYAGWNDAATKQVKALETLRDKYNKDSQGDKVDDVNKKIETLKHTMKKYASYGGSFDKPKKAKTTSPSSLAKSFSITKAAGGKVSPPKGVKVSVPRAPSFKTTNLKKLSVSKIPSNYRSKKLA